ncbi:MAG: hypothetical protein IIZ35_06850 [Clostridia bacterium]|nr:hypothetical protein [Clostridia bacterium]
MEVLLTKPTGAGTTTDLGMGYVDEGTTISYTTSAKPGASTLWIYEWYADGSMNQDDITLAAGEVYTVPENVIQIGLNYA